MKGRCFCPDCALEWKTEYERETESCNECGYPSQKCDECGTLLNDGCARCGAPVCCPKCCREQN